LFNGIEGMIVPVLFFPSNGRWISQRTRQNGDRLIWDTKEERFISNDWGNYHLDRPRRNHYTLPNNIIFH